MKYLIDTDILIDCLRGHALATKFLQKAMDSSPCLISPITIAELFAGVRDGKERPILEQFVNEFQVTLLNDTIAQQGGLFRRDYGQSHGVGLADALIAATTLHYNITLATLNKKHYPMLKNVYIPYKK